MRIIARNTLRSFWEKYPDAEQPLKAWFYWNTQRIRQDKCCNCLKSYSYGITPD